MCKQVLITRMLVIHAMHFVRCVGCGPYLSHPLAVQCSLVILSHTLWQLSTPLHTQTCLSFRTLPWRPSMSGQFYNYTQGTSSDRQGSLLLFDTDHFQIFLWKEWFLTLHIAVINLMECAWTHEGNGGTEQPLFPSLLGIAPSSSHPTEPLVLLQLHSPAMPGAVACTHYQCKAPHCNYQSASQDKLFPRRWASNRPTRFQLQLCSSVVLKRTLCSFHQTSACVFVNVSLTSWVEHYCSLSFLEAIMNTCFIPRTWT